MQNAPVFGRAPIPPKRRLEAKPVPLPAPSDDPVDAELHAWKAGRPKGPFPWRPFLLMAGLCFGIGSLILPDSVNDAVSWTLYAITGISFFAGFSRRRAKL